MKSLIWGVDSILRVLLISAATILVCCVAWQVLSRYVMPAPSVITDEIGRFILMWFSLLGAAYVLGQRRHLAIDLFAGLEPGRPKRILSLLQTAAVLIFVVIMIVGGLRLGLQTIAKGQVTPTLRLPMGYIYMIVPLTGFLMLFYCLDILRTVFGPDAAGPNESEGSLEDFIVDEEHE